jgi:hypothetical protein
MLGRFYFLASLIAIELVAGTAFADAGDRFSREVAMIFVKRCLECHNERDASGKLVLVDKASLAAGGDSGPAVISKDPEHSNLLERVVSGEMPPPKRGVSQKLTAAEIDALKKWITEGAVWPEGRKLDLYEATTEVRGGRDWWSLQPVRRPSIPTNAMLGTNSPIDAFIRAKLDTVQMHSICWGYHRPTKRSRNSNVTKVRMRMNDSWIACCRRRISGNAGDAIGSMWCGTPIRADMNVIRRSRSHGSIAIGLCRRSMRTCLTVDLSSNNWPAMNYPIVVKRL